MSEIGSVESSEFRVSYRESPDGPIKHYWLTMYTSFAAQEFADKLDRIDPRLYWDVHIDQRDISPWRPVFQSVYPHPVKT